MFTTRFLVGVDEWAQSIVVQGFVLDEIHNVEDIGQVALHVAHHKVVPLHAASALVRTQHEIIFCGTDLVARTCEYAICFHLFISIYACMCVCAYANTLPW